MDEETEGALNADLLERVGVPLEAAGALGWHNVRDFARHAARNQATNIWRAQHKDENTYASVYQTNATLADVFDLLAEFAANYSAVHSKTKRRPRVEKYPRPWSKDEGIRRIGRDPIPVSQFDAWYYGGE